MTASLRPLLRLIEGGRLQRHQPGKSRIMPETSLDAFVETPSYAAYARALLAARRRIGDFFDPSFFADPAFDILLELFVSGEEGARVSITSCCAAAAVPTSTALRWIGLLVEKGALVREPNPNDGRAVWVRLSEESHEAMRGWIRASVSTSTRQQLAWGISSAT